MAMNLGPSEGAAAKAADDIPFQHAVPGLALSHEAHDSQLYLLLHLPYYSHIPALDAIEKRCMKKSRFTAEQITIRYSLILHRFAYMCYNVPFERMPLCFIGGVQW
jgi:hypothetical protein